MTATNPSLASLETAAHCGLGAAATALGTSARPFADDRSRWPAGWDGFAQGLLNQRAVNEARVWFPGNPYPAGHRLDDFSIVARLHPNQLELVVRFCSARYDAESDIADPDDIDDLADWQSVGVWCNYNRCDLGGTIVRSYNDGPFDFEQPIELEVDRHEGEALECDRDELAFWQCYILGHDSVADHRMRFDANDDRSLRLSWGGRVALTYVGDDRLAHRFWLEHPGVSPLAFELGPDDADEAMGRAWLSRAVVDPAAYRYHNGAFRLG